MTNSPMRLSLIVLAVAMTLGAAQNFTSFAASPQQPNIVVFMVDDLGWNHIGVSPATMGTHEEIYHTPHLARLARNGLSFTHAYAQPNCAPTRAAMLSGQYPPRVHNQVYVVQNLNRFGKGGIGKSAARFVGPQQLQDVAAAAVTIAEALQRNGYATAHIGKFHVGGNDGPDTLPENAGFDINLGGSSQGHQPVCFASQKEGTWKFNGLGRGHFDPYAAPYTAEYLKRRGLPAELIGTPKHVSDAVGDAMEDTVQKLNATGRPFYLQFHTYAVHGPVQARPDLKKAVADRLGNKVDPKLTEYLGFISSVDENVGRLLSVLKDPNRDGNSSDSIVNTTLILFTSDNGGTHRHNQPLRGVKGEFTEGGIRVPLIAHWPGVVPVNSVTDYRVHSVDFYPTCLELAGQRWQPSPAEHPLDGESFADILKKPDSGRIRGPIFYLFPGYLDRRAQPCVVVIDDLQGKRYKLTYYYEDQSRELYCLTDDPSESRNVISSHQEIASALSRKMQGWLQQDHPTWRPKYPLDKNSGQPAGPPR